MFLKFFVCCCGLFGGFFFLRAPKFLAINVVHVYFGLVFFFFLKKILYIPTSDFSISLRCKQEKKFHFFLFKHFWFASLHKIKDKDNKIRIEACSTQPTLMQLIIKIKWLVKYLPV